MPDPQSSISLKELQRLGKNLNGYFGETIDIARVLADCVASATDHGWNIEELPVGEKKSLLALTRGPARRNRNWTPAPSLNKEAGGRDANPAPLRDAIEPAARQDRRVYISAGIHGDEPAGPLAIRELLQEDAWPSEVSLTVFPCLNPAGFLLNRRENAEGLDLNRQYHRPVAAETKAHIAWLKNQSGMFDLCLCLHEDWESHGFYVYELNPDEQPSLAEPIVARVTEVCPIDRSETIEGRPAQGGIIRPSIDPATRPEWPESFFLLTHMTRLSYTLEAPSDFPLIARTAALTVSVKTALEVFKAGMSSPRENG